MCAVTRTLLLFQERAPTAKRSARAMCYVLYIDWCVRSEASFKQFFARFIQSSARISILCSFASVFYQPFLRRLGAVWATNPPCEMDQAV